MLAELALDDVDRYSFAGELDGVRVAQLVLAPTSAQAPICRPMVKPTRARESRQFGLIAA